MYPHQGTGACIAECSATKPPIVSISNVPMRRIHACTLIISPRTRTFHRQQLRVQWGLTPECTPSRGLYHIQPPQLSQIAICSNKLDRTDNPCMSHTSRSRGPRTLICAIVELIMFPYTIPEAPHIPLYGYFKAGKLTL